MDVGKQGKGNWREEKGERVKRRAVVPQPKVPKQKSGCATAAAAAYCYFVLQLRDHYWHGRRLRTYQCLALLLKVPGAGEGFVNISGLSRTTKEDLAIFFC